MNSWRHYRLKLKKECLSYPIAYLSKYLLRAILWSCSIEIKGLEQFKEIASKEKCILILWHNRLAIVAEILNRHTPLFSYSAFISKSRDGEPLAHLANSYQRGKAIRVAHHAKHQALKQVIDTLNETKEIIVFTPDGPKGPVYKVKLGVILAARETQAALIPFSWTANRYWSFKTWDHFRVPKPFAQLTVTFGTPLYLEAEQELLILADQVEETLNKI